ncbi:MAG: pentapeptide repeat-containing protein [Hyphomicrobiaceae bacterium]
MSETQRAGAAEDEAPVNPYSLLEAVNDSSDTVHTGWLIFIAIMSYLLVAVAGVTHKDLLLSRDIPLPLLQVPIELTKFFLFAPIVLVLFHVGIVTQLVMLARKTLELDKALQMLEVTDRRTHPLRLELHNFFFVQAIAGPERSRIVSGLLHGLSWMTLVVLPVVLLLYVQISFLPYHDVTITWAHRIALVVDVGMLALLGVFLSRPEQSLGHALLRASVGHPLTALMTIAVLGGVAIFSLFVATVPGERLDRIGRGLMGVPSSSSPAGLGSETAAYGYVLPLFGWTVDGRLFGLFERNLNVTDLDLVNDKDVTPGEATLNFQRRDLRFARLDRSDIHQADLTGANLDGASLVGTDLRGVALHCADANLLLLSANRQAANCPSARAPISPRHG